MAALWAGDCLPERTHYQREKITIKFRDFCANQSSRHCNNISSKPQIATMFLYFLELAPRSRRLSSYRHWETSWPTKTRKEVFLGRNIWHLLSPEPRLSCRSARPEGTWYPHSEALVTATTISWKLQYKKFKSGLMCPSADGSYSATIETAIKDCNRLQNMKRT